MDWISPALAALTVLGDSGFLFALALAVLACLALKGRWRPALAVALVFAAAAAGTAFLKIVFMSCGFPGGALAIRSPSGHAAMAAAVIGITALLAVNGRKSRWRYVLITAALLLIAAIAVSRVALKTHTVAEVLSGLALGSLVAALAYVFVRREAPLKPQGTCVLMAAFLVAFLAFGPRWHVEPLLVRWAERLKETTGWCKAGEHKVPPQQHAPGE